MLSRYWNKIFYPPSSEDKQIQRLIFKYNNNDMNLDGQELKLWLQQVNSSLINAYTSGLVSPKFNWMIKQGLYEPSQGNCFILQYHKYYQQLSDGDMGKWNDWINTVISINPK